MTTYEALLPFLTFSRLNSDVGCDIVTLLVGPSQHKMTAHRALLAFNSEYFEAAFYGSLKSVDSVYIMPEAEVAGVRGFVSWTYTGVFKCFRTGSDQDYEEALLKCWVTGDMLLAPQFVNEVMRGLCNWFGEDRVWPYVGSVRYIYNNTPPESVLLQFIKDVTKAWGPFRNDGHNSEHKEKWAKSVE